MSEFDIWWNSRNKSGNRIVASTAWHARDSEVEELKRQLSEIGELLKTSSRQYSIVLKSNNDLRKQLSEDHDATLVDEDSYVAWLRYIRVGEGTSIIRLCNSDSEGAFKVYRLRQGKEKG